MNTSSIVRTAVGMRVPQEKGTVYEAGGACAWKKRRLKSYWNSLTRKKYFRKPYGKVIAFYFFQKRGLTVSSNHAIMETIPSIEGKPGQRAVPLKHPQFHHNNLLGWGTVPTVPHPVSCGFFKIVEKCVTLQDKWKGWFETGSVIAIRSRLPFRRQSRPAGGADITPAISYLWTFLGWGAVPTVLHRFLSELLRNAQLFRIIKERGKTEAVVAIRSRLPFRRQSRPAGGAIKTPVFS